MTKVTTAIVDDPGLDRCTCGCTREQHDPNDGCYGREFCGCWQFSRPGWCTCGHPAGAHNPNPPYNCQLCGCGGYTPS